MTYECTNILKIFLMHFFLIINNIILFYHHTIMPVHFETVSEKYILKPKIKFAKIFNHLLSCTNSSLADTNENATVVILLRYFTHSLSEFNHKRFFFVITANGTFFLFRTNLT